MKLIYASKDLTPNAKYRMTVSEDSSPLTQAAGVTIPVDTLILYSDTDHKSGEEREFVKILDADGYIYSSGGATVLRQVKQAIDYLSQYPDWTITAIRPGKATSRQGREYQTVEITLGERNPDSAL